MTNEIFCKIEVIKSKEEISTSSQNRADLIIKNENIPKENIEIEAVSPDNTSEYNDAIIQISIPIQITVTNSNYIYGNYLSTSIESPAESDIVSNNENNPVKSTESHENAADKANLKQITTEKILKPKNSENPANFKNCSLSIIRLCPSIHNR